MQNPRQYKIPDWFLNRQKDVVDGKYSQVNSQFIQIYYNPIFNLNTLIIHKYFY